MKKGVLNPTAVRRSIPWANARGLRQARREARRLYRIVNRSMRPFVGMKLNAETKGHIQMELEKVVKPNRPIRYIEIQVVIDRD